VETGHGVVRGEPCHYSEPASMPEEAGQPSGRLLLTANRALFVGSGKTIAAAWHTISVALHAERDHRTREEWARRGVPVPLQQL
jgi:hypothetical protein